MKVSAVVVSHGHARELEESLPALAPQVDELVVVANVPGSVGALPDGTRVLESPRPRTFAANVNAGVAATSGEYVLVSNPDAVPEEGAIAALVRFADEHPRAGLVGPLVFWPDGTWQPSLRRFPTVARNDLAPHAAAAPALARTSTRRRTTGRGRSSRCRATGCSAGPAC